MKKLLLSLTISTMCLQMVQSRAEAKDDLINQSQTKQDSELGSIAPVLGVSSFTLKTEGYNVSANSGLNVGVNYTYDLNSDLSAEVSLSYLQAGGLQKGYDSQGFYVQNQLNLSYLSTAFGARYKFLNYGNSLDQKIYLKAGVAPSFLMSAKQKVSVDSTSIEKDIKANTNSYDLMGYLGLGGTYKLDEQQNLLFEINYMRGTKQVLKDFNSKNEGFIIAAMYSIKL